MNVFFTSDQHFGHFKIIEYCNRPFASAPEMDEAMIDAWNRVVGKNDLVWHLGDFALVKGPHEEIGKIRRRLNGRIRLVMGNHDRRCSSCYLKEGFEQVYKHDVIVNLEGSHLYLSHRPIMERRGGLNLHGHIHNRFIENCPRWLVNVSVEQWKYEPVPLKKLREFVKHDIQEDRPLLQRISGSPGESSGRYSPGRRAAYRQSRSS